MTTLDTQQHVDVHQLGGRIGAEVRNIDLSVPLDEATVADLVAALHRHKALVFRDQHLDDDGHERFIRSFGPVTRAHPTLDGDPDHPNVLVVNGPEGVRSNRWHTDVTFVVRPPKITSLRAVTVPPYGGETIVANQEAAYRDLAEPLQRFADTLWAVHTNDYDYVNAASQSTAALAHGAKFVSRKWKVAHPVVRVHPETGEKSLFVTGFARGILGLSQQETSDVYRLLERAVLRPENQFRWRWSPGDVLLFDNRNTTHYAPDDFGDQPRELHRITAAGDVPVGTDGRHSWVIEGDEAEHYTPAT